MYNCPYIQRNTDKPVNNYIYMLSYRYRQQHAYKHKKVESSELPCSLLVSPVVTAPLSHNLHKVSSLLSLLFIIYYYYYYYYYYYFGYEATLLASSDCFCIFPFSKCRISIEIFLTARQLDSIGK